MVDANMTRSVFGLILVNVLLTSLAQVILKAGMSADAVQASLAQGARWSTALVVGSNPLVLLGLAMYFASAVIWLLILARVEVSLAYPFVGLGFVITMLLGWWIHGDTLSLMRVGGTVLIAVGVAVLAHS
jgi:multidrug transporter EmrE-like cation transporter